MKTERSLGSKKRRLLIVLIASSGLILGACGFFGEDQKESKESGRRNSIRSNSERLAFEQLQAIGYVDGTYDANSDFSGVILHDAANAHPGLNFYNSRKQSRAVLMDMEGNELHSWRGDNEDQWQSAELTAEGDVIVIAKDQYLSRYDKESNLLWSVEGRFHHDLWIHDGKIFVLARVSRLVDYIHPRSLSYVDVIQIRSLQGELEREISILDMIQESAYGFLLPSLNLEKKLDATRYLDVLHTNHVEVFDGRLADSDPIYAKGNILISMRNINTIAIIDGETLKIVWIWGPTNLSFQHHPTLLENGHLLVFDNGTENSRVVEVDPLSREIVWQYAPESGFFSDTRGSNQRLANGNTLITESDTGYVFEVTPNGNVVWKFANPNIDSDQVREAIWRMTRISPDSLSFLD